MNPLVSKVIGVWTHHRPAVLLSGAGVAVALGYRQHQHAAGGGATDPAAADAADGATVAGYAPAGATGAAGAYDSTSNDIYNALQPQIEQTQSMLEKLLDAAPTTVTKTVTKIIRVPAKKPATKHPKPPKKKHHKPAKKKPAKTPKKKPAVHHPAHHVKAKAPHKLPATTPHKAVATRAVVVQRGQTLDTIARQHKVSPVALRAANRATLAHRPAQVGQRIVIPRRKR